MHQLQRIGLWGITILLLLGFWAGLWYQGRRTGDSFITAGEERGAAGESGDSLEISRDADGREAPGKSPAQGGSDTQSPAAEAYLLSDPEESAPEELAVHVVGGVASPGLYFLPRGSRIYDAVMIAEPEEGADLSKINMALPLEDGMQIRIPLIGKLADWGGEALILRSSENQEYVQGATEQGGASGKVNINKASAKELETLPGIGPAYSQRIIQYREQNGGFKSIEDLMKVKGIGTAKMSDLRDLVVCS
ncbi:MAG: ComEA family DNA-binding protein [Clostridiales bacterium]|nr:ComEA family DNA-binding protein [Clostridiales bacterium]